MEDKEMLELIEKIESGEIKEEELDEATAQKVDNYIKNAIRKNLDEIKRLHEENQKISENIERIDKDTEEIYKDNAKTEKEIEELKEKLNKSSEHTKDYQNKIKEIFGNIEEE